MAEANLHKSSSQVFRYRHSSNHDTSTHIVQDSSKFSIPKSLPIPYKFSNKTADSSGTTSAGMTPKTRFTSHHKSGSHSSMLSMTDLSLNSSEKKSKNYFSDLAAELALKDSMILDLNLKLHEKNMTIKELKLKIVDQDGYETRKKLELKELECDKLKELLDKGEKNYVNRIENETKRLVELVKDGDLKLESLSKEICVLNEINSKLQIKQKNLIKIIADCSKENKLLKNSKYGLINMTELHDIENQFTDIEELQNKLIYENNDLKHQLEQAVIVSENNIRNQISDLSAGLYRIMLELTQLVRIVNIMQKGKKIDLEFLLGITKTSQEVNGDHLEQCKNLTTLIRQDLITLREVLSDVYAENCGDKCSTQ